MWCLVNLPNGTTSGVQCDPKRISQECLEKVCADLGIICETDYFGLIPVRDGDSVADVDECNAKQWINLRNPLHLYTNDRTHPIVFSLRVKFWVPAHLILQSSVRSLFYMQARQELFDGHLRPSSWTNAAYLAALLLQADGFRYDPTKVPAATVQTLAASSEETAATASQSSSVVESSASAASTPERRPQPQQLRRPSKRKCSEIECKRGSVSSQSSGGGGSSPPTGWHLDDMGPGATSGGPTTATTTGGGATIASAGSVVELSSKAPKNIYHRYGALRPAFDEEAEEGKPPVRPENFHQLIAIEHEKLSRIKMSASSAQYWLLEEVCSLVGYGEEIFEGVTIAEPSVVCKIGVSPHGLTIVKDDEKYSVPFTAVKAAKSIKRSFRLTYMDERHEETHVELKLPNHRTAASLYRAITEKHVFYSCETVRPVVTTQFIRDLKGTIVSMFNEDTELGKRYVFDIQRTCREVYDAARRTLHARGIEISNGAEEHGAESPAVALGRLEATLSLQKDDAGKLERMFDERIREAITCPICADGEIDTTFLPCGHMTACRSCAVQCDRCPLCRSNIESISKIFLPPLLQSRKGGSTNATISSRRRSDPSSTTSTSIAAPKSVATLVQ
ncbi:E3 ubiquitin-protein ligase MYLIP [Anopheles ziemanni]|uniref:E3 ubiquitin-protein ligase MYLIP n=1 Tax=Anopheles coustani TaxID=139045 RepID=UPI00265AFF95|nr:E3 ubiquitin-protein ligase MYLIP [Anopheles coustani]XP_058174551.1 E3 ubiquitin-protein ligase MYLIP [Anopheles ziemanni]